MHAAHEIIRVVLTSMVYLFIVALFTRAMSR